MAVAIRRALVEMADQVHLALPSDMGGRQMKSIHQTTIFRLRHAIGFGRKTFQPFRFRIVIRPRVRLINPRLSSA